jgi:hypothetical protein
MVHIEEHLPHKHKTEFNPQYCQKEKKSKKRIHYKMNSFSLKASHRVQVFAAQVIDREFKFRMYKGKKL